MKDLNLKPELKKLTSSQFATLDRELVFQELSDKELYEKCRLYGAAARLWRQKFLGLLPEVYKRKLYERKGFSSIFEFAAKLAGVSEEQVRLVLNLEKKFEDKPILKTLLENGEVSINKLARVASMATPDNQLFWASQAKILPKSALEVLIRDVRNGKQNNDHAMTAREGNGYLKPKTDQKSLPGHGLGEQFKITQSALQEKSLARYSAQTPEPQLSDEVKQKLCELQQKGIDINELILEAIAGREKKIAQEKEELAKVQNAKTGIAKVAEITAKGQEALVNTQNADEQQELADTKTQVEGSFSRHIPMKIRRLLNQEYGTKCAMPNCQREAQQIHHELPFAMLQNHNPYFLKPLCREHHVIAHGIGLAYQRVRKGAVSAMSG